jgi:hypothetical protein
MTLSGASSQEEAPMQLDIFEHSHDVMLRNDVIYALQRHDAAAARAACDRLAQECPCDESLAALGAMCLGLEGTGRGGFGDPASLRQARQALEALRPLAGQVLGSPAATQWLAPLWADLAVRAQAVPFRADSAADHAAPLWLCAGNWMAAADATAAIESWRRIPAPLAWMTEARLRMLGLQATWPMIAELGWLAPARLDELLRRCEHPLLTPLVRKFDEGFDGEGSPGDAAWFPAWALTERPEIAEHLAAAQPSQHGAPERAFRTLVELLGLERQGRQRDIVERRKTLRDLHLGLYAGYMKTR